MSKLVGVNKWQCRTKDSMQSSRQLRSSGQDFYSFFWELTRIRGQNSLMKSCTDTAFRKKSLLPEVDRGRRTTIPLWNKRMTPLSGWVGHKRYETKEQVTLLNELYASLRLYANFFLSVQKLTKKERICSKVKKIHDKAKTPYKRIIETKDISEEVKDKLKRQYRKLRLVDLKNRLDDLTKWLLFGVIYS